MTWAVIIIVLAGVANILAGVAIGVAATLTYLQYRYKKHLKQAKAVELRRQR